MSRRRKADGAEDPWKVGRGVPADYRGIDIVCRGCREVGRDHRLARYVLGPGTDLGLRPLPVPWGWKRGAVTAREIVGVPETTFDMSGDPDEWDWDDRKHHLRCQSCGRHVQVREERITAALRVVPLGTTSRVPL
ncbi:hypothetical protein FRAHR75_400013 [Frankia sp. Hr75.2]|nr:hypothetical protein FRAHR75_400013 [Frankia sp. Hr75.2]